MKRYGVEYRQITVEKTNCIECPYDKINSWAYMVSRIYPYDSTRTTCCLCTSYLGRFPPNRLRSGQRQLPDATRTPEQVQTMLISKQKSRPRWGWHFSF